MGNVERDVAALFASFLGAQGQTITSVRPGDPSRNEPDAILDTPTGPIGVEVTSGYYTEGDAKDVWAIRRGHPEVAERMVRPGESIRDALRRIPVMQYPDVELVAALQQAVEKHVARGPYAIKTYLVLDARHAAITGADDGPTVASTLCVPSASAFVAVYVVLSAGSAATGPQFFQVTRSC